MVVIIGKIFAASSATPVEFALYDRAQRSAAFAPAQDIVIVDIDDASIAELGAWPWPRTVHAGLLDKLHESASGVVAFTLPFGVAESASEMDRIRAALKLLEESNFEKSAQAQQLRDMLAASNGLDPNERLAQAIAAHGNVVLPVTLRTGGEARALTAMPQRLALPADESLLERAASATEVGVPQPELANVASAVGHTYLQPDPDGVVRSELVAIRAGDALVPSLALAVAARAQGVKLGAVTFDSHDTLHIGDRTVPLERQLKARPQYYSQSGARTFTHYSYRQVLAGEVPAEQLRGKIVLVGSTDPDAKLTTPVDGGSTAATAIASTVSSLLDATLYSRPTSVHLAEWALVPLVLLFAGFLLPPAGLRFGGIATALLLIILVSTEIGMLSSARLWVQLMMPSAALAMGFISFAASETMRRANRGGAGKDPSQQLRTLGQTFQKQGQLDLAFETYQRCPLDAPTMELLYYLGTDFERRRQNQKAAAVYAYIATRDPNYRDLRVRRARVKEDPVTRDTPPERTVPPKPAGVPPPRRAAPPDEEEDRPKTPARTLGRYEIERELGKGAMGVVYLGRDPKINRIVAIKAIPLAQEFGEEDLAEARARFFREAEMAGRLNHPAIVTVYDAGEDAGLAYIAMEYLRGQHLSYFTDSAHLLPPEQVMLLAARTAEALNYAHRQNVVHRDIKPANIMFNPETDELKITDFGIARLTDTSRTKTGIVLGTPSFMSPEQLEGRSLDGRSDQFALGVSLYQLLCAQLPFRGDSMPRLMQKIATEPHTAIRLVRPDLPPQIETIIDRVLQKDADERYPSCAELAVALRECAQSIAAAKPARSEHEWLIP